MALTLEKLSRKALAAGDWRWKKTMGKGSASKPAASAMPLSWVPTQKELKTRLKTQL